MVTVETQRKAENESLLRSHETTEEADRRHGADHVAEESTSRGEGRDEHCHRRPAMSPRYSARQRSPPWKQRCDRNRRRQRTKGGENRAIGAVETQQRTEELLRSPPACFHASQKTKIWWASKRVSAVQRIRMCVSAVHTGAVETADPAHENVRQFTVFRPSALFPSAISHRRRRCHRSRRGRATAGRGTRQGSPCTPCM